MSEQMKPCPFPHSAEDGEGNPADYPPSVVLGIGSKVGECWVECEWCGASGPAEATEAAAIAAWNQRAGCASCRDEAIGAALAVEQKCYDQAQEIAALRARIEIAQSIIQEPFRDYLTEAEWNESKLYRLSQAIWGEPVKDDLEASDD